MDPHSHVGIDVGFSFIKTYLFHSEVECDQKDYVFSPPQSPGAFTIFLSEIIESIDENSLRGFVTVAIPGILDDCDKKVISCALWPGWIDVPLAKWLEARLHRTISLIAKPSFSLIEDASIFYSHN
ncbi:MULTISPECIES: ROK family protein [unclassified Prochlorococcus]|uniref:ROK family protein n=1 Tax=unclassified Prochlorococcus TaxID=2627481 RepID=UPI000533872C|nr:MULTISPECIES: ROK family protein [unclassified Prochlorococcus]KGG15397.1 ROK family sugar kinase [Prochlorococcus sp. MIT 0602]KGG17675.1 ROK family sugar kinase [Prochlorococcus sp. MIT 0603]